MQIKIENSPEYQLVIILMRINITLLDILEVRGQIAALSDRLRLSEASRCQRFTSDSYVCKKNKTYKVG